MGIEEFVDLDLDEFQRRANERLISLVERYRTVIEADLGTPFRVVERGGQVELSVDGRRVYFASTTASGRLLLTDVSGRYDGRL